jgi:hypothetical protein
MSHIRTRLITWICTLTAAGALGGGCLERPIATPPPRTSNTFVDQLRQTKVDKIDLLFVIDNSSSMADKQAFFANAVPQLVRRLVNPDCVNRDTGERVVGPGADVACPAGLVKDFGAIDDIHIGVVTSSLGGHGGDACAEGWWAFNPTQDDHAHLLPSVRAGVPDQTGLGFLAWDPAQKGTPPGTGDLNALSNDFAANVSAAGESGCGYEATLEAWYRFLIDPDPPARVIVEAGRSRVDGVDQTVLDQRKAFMRPDSLLAVVMLTDENDCSVVDGGSGWAVATDVNGTFRMPSATSACASDPNASCCRSCSSSEKSPPAGCAALADDPGCQTTRLSAAADPPNLRCFEQKRRFGIDLLYPTSRYVDALKSHSIENRAGQTVPNPIFTSTPGSGVPPRDDDLVFLAGIVGVPWQDLATSDSLTSPTELTYLTAEQLTEADRWITILGDPENGVPAADPLMHESVAPRTGTNPITGAPLVDPSSTDPRANPINGHEYNPAQGADLQYACTFELPVPVDCATRPDGAACDCTGSAEALAAVNSPLCNPVIGGPATTRQHYAKAYPGLRHLEVLRGFGKNSIVASICPKVTTGELTDASYGYNPAVAAIIDRLSIELRERCLPRELTPDPVTERLPCAVVEASRRDPCECSGPGYSAEEIPDATRDAVLTQLESSGACSTRPGPNDLSCDAFCLCRIAQTLEPEAKRACENDPVEVLASDVSGYCYIDPARGVGNEALVKECPETQRRMLRFVGSVPAPKSSVFMACAGTSRLNP